MSADQGWGAPGHAERYRRRVLAEQARLAAELADLPSRQQNVLTDLLDFNRATDFGRRHDFAAIRTLKDFRTAVPIQDYAAHAPWIERMAAGEPGVLTADAPVVYFTSSGSTGAHKKIPVTRRFMKTVFFPFYYAAWAPLIESFPELMDRPDAMLNLKHDPPAAPPVTADGHPHVGASQVDFGTAFGEPLAAEMGTAAPWAALRVAVAPDDHLERMYLRLRLAVHSDVRGLIGINPAVLAAVPYLLGLWWQRIVKEVRDGTLGGVPYGPGDPGLAARLEALADSSGQVRPGDVWPRIRALFGWTTGVASLYLPALRERFGSSVAALPAPVAASEGPVAVPLDTHPTAGTLIPSACVYEFADADDDLRPDTATLLPQDLEPDRDYHVVFSHVGGLYRYAVGDVVRVVDRVRGVPRLMYAGRSTRSDAAGERLREAQVVRALQEALAGAGVTARNVACRVTEPAGGPPRYQFAVAPETPWPADASARFTALLDTALGSRSAGYARALRDRRLGGAELRLLHPDSFQRDWHARVAEGNRPAQVKDRLFRQEEPQWRRLVAASDAPRGEGT
ncbi:GH3 family domain-containing protein [Streptomyces cinerochromogenes]|uniref:GH3 family domain-containing protein n=1 Tax=Streptomyces cinerochromogenes TaxID=66422 RepID=UPI0033A68DE0